MEIDPYLPLTLYCEGVTTTNVEDFLGGERPIDVLVDACDSLAIKVLAFAKHADDRATHRANGLAYTAGVVLSFLALGGRDQFCCTRS